MKKIDWTIIAVMLVVLVALFVVIWFVLDDVIVSVVLGVTFLIIWVLCIVAFKLIRVLPKRSRENDEIKLSRQCFNAQKSYLYYNEMGINVTVDIDFDNKQLASNKIYNLIVPFSRVASGRIEISSYGTSKTRSIVNYVISITRKDNDLSYDYIEIFNTIVNNSCLGADGEITEQMLQEYPALKDIVDLDQDIQKIMEINIADGVAMREATEEELQHSEEFENFDIKSDNDDEPHYTKPPHWNSRW